MVRLEYVIFITLFMCVLSQKVAVLQRMYTEIPCKTSAECQPHSACVNNKCKCDENYIVNTYNNSYSYKCLRIAIDISSECEEDIQCQITLGTPSLCNKQVKKCDCEYDAHFDRESVRCFKTAGYGQNCTEEKQCLNKDGVTYAACISGTCECGDNQHLSSLGNCARKSRLGEPCEHDENCEHIQAYCNNFCECGVRYVVSQNNAECLPAALAFGDNCTELVQCTAYLKEAHCNGTNCVCDEGKHPIDSHCFRSANVNQGCNNAKECWTNGLGQYDVDCLNNYCTCISDKCKSFTNNNENNAAPIYFTSFAIFVFSLFLKLLV